MLRRRRRAPIVCALLGSLVAWAWTQAWAQDDPDGIRQPERLTVGVSDQFLGQLSPDGKSLYYLSNRNTIREVYHQDAETGQPKLLFDESADVSWGRVSPDGRRFLYISFRDDAVGQLCVRDLKNEERRCLSDGARALEAQWMGSQKIALVSRATLQGDLRLMEVTVGDSLTARPLLARNLTNPNVSPDGRWLIYVPVERYDERVGPGFAARAAQRLELLRIDGSSQPQALKLDLPGQVGQPSFSVDGRSLYFTQFFNDSNHDGVIDASDNGVIFRVPFAGDHDDAPARAAAAFPEQLTDSSWNCQYPSLSASQLITTCSRLGGSLDIYSLPPDGLVPEDWNAERLQLEIDLSSRPIEQQLLYRHLLKRQTVPTERRRTLMRLIYLHMEADEFDASEFYVHKVEGTGDPAAQGLAAGLELQIAHRRAMRARESGRLGMGFGDESRARLSALDPNAPGKPAVLALRRVVRSEIFDSLGDKEGARKELEAASIGDVVVPAIVEAFYRRADALYRQLDDGPALWLMARGLAEHPHLLPEQRLRYAQAAVRALVRGQSFEDAETLLAKHRAEVAPDSELGFALDLAQVVLRIRDEKPDKVRIARDAIVAFYKTQSRLDRKRAVMLEAVARATDVDAERVIEALVLLYVEDVPKGTRERQRAERVFQRFMEGRAYRRMAIGHLDGALDDFDRVAKITGSFESHIGHIDLRLRAGVKPAQLLAEYEKRDGDHSKPVAQFVRAYLLSLHLPTLDDEKHEKTAQEVFAAVRKGGAALRSQPMVRALVGTVMHERYLRTGQLALAQRADANYLIALELFRRNPRYRAMVLNQLSLLHMQVGNYRIAHGFQKDRDLLPFLDDAAGLLQHLVKARTLLHLGKTEDAVKVAEAALTICDRTPALKEYRVLVLDRAALYNLSAGRFDRALALYDAELPLLTNTPEPAPAAARNQLVVRLARAAAALGAKQPRKALEDLAIVDADLSSTKLTTALHWPHAEKDEVLRSYRLFAAGLRGQAHRSLGELDAAAKALLTQRMLSKQRLDAANLDEQVRALALAEAQLVEVAAERHAPAEADRWMKEALGHADAFLRRTKTPVSAESLALLWLAAEQQVSTAAPLRAVNLADRLRADQAQIAKDETSSLRSYARLLEIYIALTTAQKR